MSDLLNIDDNNFFDPQSGEFYILPKIILFMADRNLVTDDKPVTLNWEVENASRVTINDMKVPNKGSKKINFKKTQSVSLFATGRHNLKVERTIRIQVDDTPPLIRLFTADVTSAIRGAAVTFFWEIEKARQITIDNGVGDVTGLSSKTVTVGDSGVYKISALNHFGVTTEAQIEITIFPVSLIEGVFVPEPPFTFRRFFMKKPFYDFDQLPVPVAIDGRIRLNPPASSSVQQEGNRVTITRKFITALTSLNGAFKLFASNQQASNTTIKLLWKRILKKWRKEDPRQDLTD